jgi:hypothetical protein
MPQFQAFVELVKVLGFPAVIFAVWYLYHQSQAKAWTAREKAQFDMFSLIAKERDVRDERNYEILKEMLEVSRYQSTILARMDTKIDTNQFCPMVREGAGH